MRTQAKTDTATATVPKKGPKKKPKKGPENGPENGPSKDRRSLSRLTGVGVAVLAALAVWAAFEPLGGIELRAPAPGGAGRTHDVGPLTVLMPSLLASLAGWGLLVVLERFVRRARMVWTVVAVVVLALSLGGPLSATGISTLNQLALATMHVAVAATLIPLLARTSEHA